MRNAISIAILVVLAALILNASRNQAQDLSSDDIAARIALTQSVPSDEPVERVTKTEEEWAEQLTDEQFYVTRKKGTERAWSGEYNKNKETGTYQCVCCGSDLFESSAKFDSGTGWPSFWAPASQKQVGVISDRTHGMVRTEIVCNSCDAHLGHVFNDGPKPTGLRYCVNSASLSFVKAESKKGSDAGDVVGGESETNGVESN